MKKLTILLLVVSLIALLYGCCSNSGDSVFVNIPGDVVITSREVVIDERGRLPTVIFPSGVRIAGEEEDTLQPGIKVCLTEQSMTSKYAGYFSENTDMYIYKITAFQEPLNSVGKRTYVTTIEKPFKVRLPNNGKTGLSYIGLRESDTDPWRFMRVYDENENPADIASSRASAGIVQKECVFNLHRLSTSFCLVVYNDNNSRFRLPETAVDSLVASSASILVKEGRYMEDLPIKGILKGIRLDSINPTDLRALITYRNNRPEEALLKVNGVNVAQTNISDKTVPGYSYRHSFTVDSLTESNFNGMSGDYAFILNVNGVETDSFSKGFLIEFYNKINDEKILPYNYTEFYTPNTTESVTLAVGSDESNIADEGVGLYKWNPTFTVISSYEFNESDKKRIAESITVSDVDSEKIRKDWNGRVLAISFTENLLPDKNYIISMAEVTGLENAVVAPFEDFNFTTIYQYCNYSVVHQQENISDSKYTVVETENLTAIENAQITPTVRSYEGFESPVFQTITIASDTENKVVYSYNRKVSKFTVNKGPGIATVSGGGSYKYGADVAAGYTLEDGYEFGGWTGDMAVATFTMPDHDVTMTANTGLISYSIVYNNIDGCTFTADNPVTYNTTSDTITLSNPTKNGYTFNGWSGTGLTGSDSVEVTIPNHSTGDREYTANWSLNLNLVIASNTGCLIDEEKELYYTLASFTVMPVVAEGVVLTDQQKSDILDAVFVKDIGDNLLGEDILQKSWQNGKIALNFTKDLNASTTYTISCDTIPGANLVLAPSLPFKTFYYKGRGVESLPFLVENAVQLDFIRNYQTYCFKQTVDIDIASFACWSPIGDDTNQFTGTYDGNTKKISNLKINTDQQIQYTGIFGYSAGTMKNITVDGFSVTGGNNSTPLDSEYTGVIIGYNTGEVTDCSITDSSNSGSIIFGMSCVGGICACSEGSISSCYVDSSDFQLEHHTDDNSYVGGICGYCPNGVITNCHVASSTFKGQSDLERVYVGGITGRLVSGSISSCEVSHLIVQAKCNAIYAFAGGIGGMNEGSINSCRVASCTVKLLSDSNRSNAGGICSANIGSINFCRVDDSEIYGNMERDYCGGISSQCSGGNINSCQVFNINVQSYLSGGISGLLGSNGSITSCNVASSTFNGEYRIGGIVAASQGGSSVVSCNVENSICEGNKYVGGICGQILNTGSTITGCQVTSSKLQCLGNSNNLYLGGIVGVMSKGNINSCQVASLSVQCSDNYDHIYLGGICGDVYGSCNIISCNVQQSRLLVPLCYMLGGICGWLSTGSNVTSCYVDSSMVEGNNDTGGICGCMEGALVSACYVKNSTINGNNKVGGIAGQIQENGSVSDCYLENSVVHNASYSGGISGNIADNGGSISSCYVHDSTVEGSSYTGYIVGRIGSGCTVSDNFTDNTGAISSSGSSSNCYNSVTDFTIFCSKAWSDGLSYNNENSVWKKYNISESIWPPDLKDLPRQ